jgi:hypothetical protein
MKIPNALMSATTNTMLEISLNANPKTRATIRTAKQNFCKKVQFLNIFLIPHFFLIGIDSGGFFMKYEIISTITYPIDRSCSAATLSKNFLISGVDLKLMFSDLVFFIPMQCNANNCCAERIIELLWHCIALHCMILIKK